MRKHFGIPQQDLTGKIFSKLTVLNFDSWIKQGKNTRVSYWKCKCDCGNFKKVKGTHLTRGDTKSCGCFKPNKLEKGEAAFNLVLKSYQRHAFSRNYEWALTKLEAKTLFLKSCTYCGDSPSNSMLGLRGNGEFKYNGIDRINNNEGYIIENVVSCCSTCNRMKSNLSYKEFINHISKIGKICQIK